MPIYQINIFMSINQAAKLLSQKGKTDKQDVYRQTENEQKHFISKFLQTESTYSPRIFMLKNTKSNFHPK